MTGDGRAVRHRDANGNFAEIPEEERPPIEDLKRLYVDEGLTLIEVGERVGFGGNTVGKWLTEAGVPMRSPSVLPSESGREGEWREIAGQRKVPYDRDRDGNVLTNTVDVLSCGHTKTIFFHPSRRYLEFAPTLKERRCYDCEKGDPPVPVEVDVAPGCCDACEGKGGLGCWDCQGTGHTHPETEDC